MTGLAAVCAGSLHGNGGVYSSLQCGFSYLCCPVHQIPYSPQLSAVVLVLYLCFPYAGCSGHIFLDLKITFLSLF